MSDPVKSSGKNMETAKGKHKTAETLWTNFEIIQRRGHKQNRKPSEWGNVILRFAGVHVSHSVIIQ